MKNQKNRGITLIALVITIVVLVILVGVSVSVAINTGLIANSKKAVADYDTAQSEEKAEIKKVEDIINSMDPNSLAAKVKVGDYVEYKPVSGTTYTSIKGNYEECVDEEDGSELLYQKLATINENGEATGTGIQGNGVEDQTFTVPVDTSTIKWRVLSIENGKVNLVSEKPIGRNGIFSNDTNVDDMLHFNGITGYAYAEEEINAVCSIYGTGKGAESGRSIDASDVNKLIEYEPTEAIAYGWEEGKYWWKNTASTFTSSFDGALDNTELLSYWSDSYDDLFGYWLATRAVDSENPDDQISFGAGMILMDYEIFEASIFLCEQRQVYGFGNSNYVRPVVTLKSDLKVAFDSGNGSADSPWKFE